MTGCDLFWLQETLCSFVGVHVVYLAAVLGPRLQGSRQMTQIFARTKASTLLPCVYTGPAELDELLNG